MSPASARGQRGPRWRQIALTSPHGHPPPDEAGCLHEAIDGCGGWAVDGGTVAFGGLRAGQAGLDHRPGGGCRDPGSAIAVGHRQLQRLPQHLRQPGDPRSGRQNRPAGRHGLALYRPHHPGVRPAVRHSFPGRKPADAGRRGVQHHPHHRPGAQEFAAQPVRPDRLRRGHRPQPGDPAHQNPLSRPAGAIGEAVGGPAGLCAEGRGCRVQPAPDRQWSVQAAGVAAWGADHAGCDSDVLARGAAIPQRGVPRRAGHAHPRGRPARGPGRPDPRPVPG